MVVPQNFPTLTHDTLTVRRFRIADLDTFWAYRNDPAVAQFQGWTTPYSFECAQQFVSEMAAPDCWRAGEWTQVAIEVGGIHVGDIGLCVAGDGAEVELGFSLAVSAQGKGYASHSMRCVLAFLFASTSVQRAVAICDSRNRASQRLLDRVHFELAATKPVDDSVFEMHYVITRDQFSSTQ